MKNNKKLDVSIIMIFILALIFILAENFVLSGFLENVSKGFNEVYHFDFYSGAYWLFHMSGASSTAKSVFAFFYYLVTYGSILLILYLFIIDKKMYSLIASVVLLVVKILSLVGVVIYKNTEYYENFLYNYSYTKVSNSPEMYIAIICLIAVIVVIAMGSKLSVKSNVIVDAPKEDNTEEIMKYKKLLDSGVISQEEYDKKKNELLK